MRVFRWRVVLAVHESVVAPRGLDSLAGFVASPVPPAVASRPVCATSPAAPASSRPLGRPGSRFRTARSRRTRPGPAPRARSARSTPPTARCAVRTSPATSWPASTGKGGGPASSFTVNQSGVDHPRQRAVERTLNVRRWDRIVGAWDDAGLDAGWVDEVVVDLDSQWGQYEYVTNVGFTA
ncbi:hypothetical protein SSBG_01121 [Streptomyces sp. SPB074]|nr:hypothetical protein SSBG_01121 [Streptomyces sp. SPB074]